MISIIIPTYNRFAIIQETVLRALDISSDIAFEIIIVNDGEPLPFTFNHPAVTILKNPKRGAAAARNFGAAHARYKLLFFVDDDMWITSESLDWIRKFNENGLFINNCAQLNWKYPDVLIKRLSQNKIGRFLINYNYHTLEGRLKENISDQDGLYRIYSLGSCSFVISNTLFNEIGGYDDEFIFQGEDIELAARLNQKNIPIYLVTAITCFHNHADRLDIAGFTDRLYRGFFSQFKNKNTPAAAPGKLKQFIYTLLIPFHSIILWGFNLIPNTKRLDFLTFRTIGILSSIAYFKAFYHAAK